MEFELLAGNWEMASLLNLLRIIFCGCAFLNSSLPTITVEPNSFNRSLHTTLSASELAKSVIKMKNVLQEFKSFSNSMVIGPGKLNIKALDLLTCCSIILLNRNVKIVFKLLMLDTTKPKSPKSSSVTYLREFLETIAQVNSTVLDAVTIHQ